jgi:hypothetical protein
MTTTVQLCVIGFLVAAAAAYILRAAWKTWFGKPGGSCGAACGKCAAPLAESKPEGRFPLPQA